MLLVRPIQISHALVSCGAPVVEEALHDLSVLEHDVVHVAICLTIQRNGRRLALGADALGPWWMLATSRLDAAIDVVEDKVLALIHAGCLLSYVRVEGQVLDIVLLQIGLIIGLQCGAVNATAVGIVVAPTKSYWLISLIVQLIV